jgi:prefoldin subunit 5|tara:strand:+ start:111 stop:335 length:225 start_codon:yes stop_codon:yes gene_type:complete
MTIDRKTIEERKVTLEKDVETMTNLVEKLDKERNKSLARITALSGAIQQCDQFLQELDNESDADSSIPDKKNKK